MNSFGLRPFAGMSSMAIRFVAFFQARRTYAGCIRFEQKNCFSNAPLGDQLGRLRGLRHAFGEINRHVCSSFSFERQKLCCEECHASIPNLKWNVAALYADNVLREKPSPEDISKRESTLQPNVKSYRRALRKHTLQHEDIVPKKFSEERQLMSTRNALQPCSNTCAQNS